MIGLAALRTRAGSHSTPQGRPALLGEREDLAKNLPVNAFVDRIHSSAFDILVGTGMDRQETLRALEVAARSASGPAQAAPPDENPPDAAEVYVRVSGMEKTLPPAS